MQKIHENIYAIETSLYLKKEQILIIADTHFGFEESLHMQGVLVPKTQYKQMIEQLKRILSKCKCKKIIINGDIKHEFGRITRQEWKDINSFIDFCNKNFEDIIFVKGNHDPMLKFVINKQKIKEVKEFVVGNVLIVHGDYVPVSLEKTIIIGHEHPAIILRSEAKREKYKCFIKGKYKKSVLIVEPSFNPLTEGSDITKEKKFGSFLKDLSDFEVFIYDDKTKKILKFGKLDDVI